MCYNFGRVHQTRRVTLAMEACLANHVWSIEEIDRRAFGAIDMPRKCPRCPNPIEEGHSVYMLTTGTYRPSQAETPGTYFIPLREWHDKCLEGFPLWTPK